MEVKEDELFLMIGTREVQIMALRRALGAAQAELVIVRGKVAELERQITQDYGEPMSDGVAGE